MEKQRKTVENNEFNINFNIEKLEGIGLLSARIAKVARRFEVDTEKVRARLIWEFEKLVKYCLKRARAPKEAEDGTPSAGRLSKAELKDRREWARAAAYIGQVINSISKEYDSGKIMAQLDELRQMVEKLERKERDREAQEKN